MLRICEKHGDDDGEEIVHDEAKHRHQDAHRTPTGKEALYLQRVGKESWST